MFWKVGDNVKVPVGGTDRLDRRFTSGTIIIVRITRQMRWNGIGGDVMKCNMVGLDGIGREGIELLGMGWNGIGWDGGI